MDVQHISVDREEAKARYAEYHKHRQFSQPIDDEIKRVYRTIAKGGTVIKALESIVAAGVDADGLPKLGLVRADFPRCICQRAWDGHFSLSAWDGKPRSNRLWRAADKTFRFPQGSLPQGNNPRAAGGHWPWNGYEAVVPIIPLHLRPRTALENYHVLWEVEKWSPVHVPRDPFLLRRLGEGDLWLVVAAWDLTDVERAALQARVAVN